jgi:hypothetical protein
MSEDGGTNQRWNDTSQVQRGIRSVGRPLQKVAHRFGWRQKGSNVGRWSKLYKDIDQPRAYDDDQSYHLAAAFLKDCPLVEDWGCGLGWMRTVLGPDRYRGVDGTETPFADEVVDLVTYRTSVPGLFMRHVIEHNYEWAKILDNAIASFTDRMVLIIFTPFVEETHEIAFNSGPGVPDMAFRREDLTERFHGCTWEVEEIESGTQYGVEAIFYLTKTS